MVRSAGSRSRVEPAGVVQAPGDLGSPPRRTRLRRSRRRRVAHTRPPRPEWLTTALVFAALAVAILAFAGWWPSGRLILDGPGGELYVRVALDAIHRDGYVPFWLSAFWAGSPAWVLAPISSILFVLPFAELFGPEQGQLVAMLLSQIVGAWGAFILARSLWGVGPASALAGLFFGLSPLFVSHTALFGHQSPAFVFAAVPWFTWCLVNALRRGGARWIAGSALLAAFAVIQQAEHAYGLALLALALVLAALVATRDDRDPRAAIRATLVRAGVVAGLSLGLAAHFLIPLTSLKGWFVLNPPEELRFSLGPQGIGGLVGASPSAFLTRPTTLAGEVGFFSVDIIEDGTLYLGAVLVALCFITGVLLVRDEREGPTLGAILLASAFAVWMSTALTPFSEGDLAGFLPSLLIGLFAGLFAGGLFRRMGVVSFSIAIVTVVVLAIAVPYIAPFDVLRDHVPLLAEIRFPRLYPIAMLGLALGGAYPVHAAGKWLATRDHPIRAPAPLLTLALALVLATAFLIDIWPTSSYYRLERPSVDGYVDLPERVIEQKEHGRAAVQHYPDSRVDLALLTEGWENSTGWPHPTASSEMWRLAAASWLYPPGQRARALGLTGASVLFFDDADDSTPPRAQLNQAALPLVRSYDDLVVVDDSALATDLAVDLAIHHIGVVTGDAELARSLAREGLTVAFVRGDACEQDRLRAPRQYEGAVARVCSRRPWLPNLDPPRPIGLQSMTGAMFRSQIDGLRGIDVAIGLGDNPHREFELTLREVTAEDSLGPVLRRATAAGAVDVTLTRFSFDPLDNSAGRRYAFTVRCETCDGRVAPRMATVEASDGDGDLIVDGRLDPDRVAWFALDYGGAPEARPPRPRLESARPRPGRWDVQVSAPEQTVVVVADSYFPGWTVEIDGRPARLLRVDGAFVGAEVESGDHRVTFEYRTPKSVLLSALLSGAVLIVVILMLAAPGLFRRERFRRGGRPPRGARPIG